MNNQPHLPEITGYTKLASFPRLLHFLFFGLYSVNTKKRKSGEKNGEAGV